MTDNRSDSSKPVTFTAIDNLHANSSAGFGLGLTICGGVFAILTANPLAAILTAAAATNTYIGLKSTQTHKEIAALTQDTGIPPASLAQTKLRTAFEGVAGIAATVGTGILAVATASPLAALATAAFAVGTYAQIKLDDVKIRATANHFAAKSGPPQP